MRVRHLAARPGMIGAAMLAMTSASQAETVHFKADLKAANEVPPIESKRSGALTASYDSSARRLTWDGSYSGLSGPASAAHIHRPAGPSGSTGVVFWITDNVGQCDKGGCRFKPGVKPPLRSTFHGSAQLTDLETSQLMAGLTSTFTPTRIPVGNCAASC